MVRSVSRDPMLYVAIYKGYITFLPVKPSPE